MLTLQNLPFLAFIKLTILWTCFCSNKIGISPNKNIQTGVVTLFTTTLIPNTILSYQVTFPTIMITDVLQAGLGVIGSTWTIEQQQGWDLTIISVNSSEMTIEAKSYYSTGSPSSMVKNMKIRYIVSCHPFLDIQHHVQLFDNTKDVSNINAYDEGCYYIRCRRSSFRVPYGVSKSKALNIQGIVTISGYSIHKINLDSEINDTQIFENHTVQNFYGISLSIGSFQTSDCQITTTVVGYTNLNNISVYYIVYEYKNTYTNWTNVLTGTSTVGCYYHRWGCNDTLKVQIKTNTTISTQQTYIDTMYDNMYFLGLNQFYIYHDYDSLQFHTATYTTDPPIHMQFDVGSTSIGSTAYNSPFSFTGNPNNMMSLIFTYLIDLNFNCTSGTQVYHLSQNQCGTNCNWGYYKNSTDYLCYGCNRKCQTCTGLAENQCLSCDTPSLHRVLVSNSCPCQIYNYFDDGVSIPCQKCSPTCKACINSNSPSACTQCNSTDFRQSDGFGSCPCKSSYYDAGGATCDKCHYSCVNCSGPNDNSCTACPSILLTFRNASGGYCSCITGYFNIWNQVVCSLCHFTCKTCTSTATNCVTCQNTYQRQFNNTDKTCPCTYSNGFYSNGTDPVCQACYKTCLNCNGGSKTDCTSCTANATSFRNLNSALGKCQCMTGYYQFVDDCYVCHYSCLNCTFSTSNTCISCSSANHRYLTAFNQCLCSDSFYDSGAKTCSACHASCQTCVTTSTYCLTCNATQHRVLISHTCPCQDGWVDVSGTCQKCHYSCTTCSGVLASNCLSCNMTTRIQSTTSCPCRSGLYDDGNNNQCKTCHIHCVTCQGAFNSSCLTCDPAMNRVIGSPTPNFCNCINHYYNSGPAACSLCSSTCETCVNSSSYCLTCYSSQNRFVNTSHKCECNNHYYETGADICLLCADQCEKCVNLSTTCTSCPALRNLVVNDCKCLDNYFQNSAKACIQCDTLCQKCVNSSSTCISCYLSMNRQLDNSQCICSFGFYNDTTNVNCPACPYYCHNCTSNVNCRECDPSSHRSLIGGICQCQPGYYNYGSNLVCLSCSPLCLTCSDYSVCLTCDALVFRNFVLSSCPCLDGYYSIYTIALPNTMCQPCHYSCATCDGGTNTSCINCKANRDFQFVNKSCPCSIGYYQSGILCYLCDLNCRTCLGLPTNCTSCYSGLPLVGGVCQCFSGQYSAGASLCLPCDSRCKQCQTVATSCTQCPPVHKTVLLNKDCVCGASTYQDPISLICEACDVTCLECIGSNDNQCTSCNELSPIFRKLNATSHCACLNGYFLNSSLKCQKCHNTCTLCVGASNYNCSACVATYTLIGSFCKPPLSCSDYLFDGKCVHQCPNGSYPTTVHTCLQCTNGCFHCKSSTQCINCLEGYFYNPITQACEIVCVTGKYVTALGNCENCADNCLECQWNKGKNILSCVKCALTFYLKDETVCSPDCLLPYYIPSGSLCLKCVGHCLTCNSLSGQDCITCRENTALLNKTCYTVCPNGYFKNSGLTQSICEVCPFQCQTCSSDQCLTCKQGYYISQTKCIQFGYFYSQSFEKYQCHPNCLSCTNISFSSCIWCRQNRGDISQNSIAGYCECIEGTIDMGNGICNYQQYEQIAQISSSLVSYSWSAFYMLGLVSVSAANYAGLIYMTIYMQGYSTFYYLNSTMVMQLDLPVKEYRKTNINFNLQATNTQSSVTNQNTKRVLLELQSDKSLFLRDQQFQYLIEWAFVPTVLLAIVWGFTLFISFFLCCFLRSNRVINTAEFEDYISEQDKKTIKKSPKLQLEPSKSQSIQKQPPQPLVTNPSFGQDLNEKSQHEDNQVEGLPPFRKYLLRFYSFYHESVAIVLQIIISSQIVFYGIVSFRILNMIDEQISIIKLILSGALLGYIFLYSIRLLIGAYRITSKLRLKYEDNIKQFHLARRKSQLFILFHLHVPNKIQPLNAIYLPATIIKNQLICLLMVLLSFSPIAQLAGCGAIFLAFAIYSFIFCPYSPAIRACFHISQIIMILQVILLFFTVSADYGYSYGIDIQISIYKIAWAIMSLNYIQILIYTIIGIILLFNLGKQKLCKSSKITNTKHSKNKKKHKYTNNQNDQSYQTINIQTNSMNNIHFNHQLQHDKLHQQHHQQTIQSPKKSASIRSYRLERAETTDYPLHVHNNKEEDPSNMSKDGDDFEQVVVKRYKLKRKNQSSKHSSPQEGFRDQEEEDDSGNDEQFYSQNQWRNVQSQSGKKTQDHQIYKYH